MAIKSDRWIRKMALEHDMINPFSEKQVREGVISYGVSSYGYDLRVGDEIRVAEAARASGLSEHVCLAMLEGLERAGLMAQADTHRFVRRRLDFV